MYLILYFQFSYWKIILYFRTFCSCGLDESYRSKLLDITKAYQNGTEELIKSGIYDTSDDFAVVIQPFMKFMKPPKTVIVYKIK